MAAHMGDESFVPFVPRQLTTPNEAQRQRDQSPARANSAVVQEPDAEVKTELESEVETQANSETKADVETPMIQAVVDIPTVVSEPTARGCDHALEIRREAIRLAAIACGRALRHAVLLHPGVVAAFVDDAIAAAGLPQRAHIRVHPGSIAHVRAPHYDRIGDESLSPGDVIIESNGVTLGADADARARLLVSAAAEA